MIRANEILSRKISFGVSRLWIYTIFCLKKDGSFEIDDVPACSFFLYIELAEPARDPLTDPPFSTKQKVIGSLIHNITVPEMPDGRSDEPLELGSITLNVHGKPVPF